MVRGFFQEIAALTGFTIDFFKASGKRPFEFKEFLRQCYKVGNTSLLLITLTGFILGVVLTLQSRPVLAEFGAESWLPMMVASSIVIEIGPVVTALICAGKVGSSIGAELGSMRVTEQIDAMEVSGTYPMRYVVVTRVLACTLMIPLLTFYSDAVSFLGSYVGVNMHTQVSFTFFIDQIFASFQFDDLIPATIKTFFFGFAIGIVGSYKGYNAGRGTEGVGSAANSAVINASLAVFIIDLIAVQITQLVIKYLG